MNRQEILTLTGEKDVIAAAEAVQRYGVEYVVMTFSNGSRAADLLRQSVGHISGNRAFEDAKADLFSAAILHRGRCEFVPASPVALPGDHETTGAGDAFAAGVLWGFLQGYSTRVWGYIGQTMARSCIQKRGARAGVPGRDDLHKLYQSLFNHRLEDADAVLTEERAPALLLNNR